MCMRWRWGLSAQDLLLEQQVASPPACAEALVLVGKKGSLYIREVWLSAHLSCQNSIQVKGRKGWGYRSRSDPGMGKWEKLLWVQQVSHLPIFCGEETRRELQSSGRSCVHTGTQPGSHTRVHTHAHTQLGSHTCVHTHDCPAAQLAGPAAAPGDGRERHFNANQAGTMRCVFKGL